MASRHKDMTKHITNGINHALVEESESSDETATAPSANDGSGLKINKIDVFRNSLQLFCLNINKVFQ